MTIQETLEQQPVTIVPEYTETQEMAETCYEAASELMTQPEAQTAPQIITEVMAVSRLFRERSLYTKLEHGSDYIELQRCASRTSDGRGLAEIFEVEQVYHAATHKRPTTTVRAMMDVHDRQYQLVASNGPLGVTVHEMLEKDKRMVVSATEQTHMIHELYERITRAYAAAHERDEYTSRRADESAKRQLIAISGNIA